MGEAGCFAALAWVIVCPYRDRFFQKKFGEQGLRFVYLRREVRLHLSIAFESQLSSLCIQMKKQIFRIDSFRVL